MPRTHHKAFGTLTLALTLALQWYAGAAVAAPPANVVGTWTVQVNQDVEEFIIENQGVPGKCKRIIGHINVSAEPPLIGWYCPSTGRFHILHNNASTNATVRTFTGNVSDSVEGVPDKMAGTVAIIIGAFGDLGERNFSATRE
jgi:hypothetical protein